MFSAKNPLNNSSILVGVLVDVSGSMQVNFPSNDDELTDKEITRIESVFNTLLKIAEREVSNNRKHKIFVQAFGLDNYKNLATCDLLKLLEKIRPLCKQTNVSFEPLIDLVEKNGAPYARKYIEKHLTTGEATFLYDYYSNNRKEMREIIDHLPAATKNSYLGEATRRGTGGFEYLNDYMSEPISFSEAPYQKLSQMLFKMLFSGQINQTKSYMSQTEKEQTRTHALEAIINVITKKFLDELRENAFPQAKTFKSAIDLLLDVTGKSVSENTTIQARSLLKDHFKRFVSYIEPFIYGQTPMCEAIGLALEVFKTNNHDDKVLFLLTDGEATDGEPDKFVQQILDENICVLVCLITSENIDCPRSLKYSAGSNWLPAQKNMFELSSTVDNSHSAMSILLQHGWELPAEGQSRLFVQANHPDVIDEFSTLVRSMTENVDALLSIFGRVSLDQYINLKMSQFEPPSQVGGTCYANAVAAVLHLAMKRIFGRQGGVPEFDELRQEIIRAYGEKGANTASVLDKWTKKYRLNYKEIDELSAKQAINARRPVVARFSLCKEEWDEFSKFYRNNPRGILEKEDLNTPKTLTKNGGHAVVLMKCDPHGLTFMNSWGNDWADNGFFKVRDQSVLNVQFFDVYWTLNDLFQKEKDAYEQKKRKDGEDFVRELPESITMLPFKCPQCAQSSPAKEFVGHLLDATCPKCKRTFKPTPLGFVLNW